MNYDFGYGSGPGGFVNRSKDCCQFRRFLFEGADSSARQQAAFLRQFDPEERFVGFFQSAADFVNPIGSATGAASSTIARGHRSCGPQHLVSYHFSLGAARQRVSHSHHPQRKFALFAPEVLPDSFSPSCVVL
jgi:hypothetical protein